MLFTCWRGVELGTGFYFDLNQDSARKLSSLYSLNLMQKRLTVKDAIVTNDRLILILKVCISAGISLILLGIYLHNFNETVEAMGVTGIIISALCVALGMVLSLPTKMYLTFLLVRREAEKQE